MQIFHIERHALDIPHTINSFFFLCVLSTQKNDFIIKIFLCGGKSTLSVKCLLLWVEKPHRNYQDQPHHIMRGIIHLYSMWKIRKSQCMWKVHIISTLFSESVVMPELLLNRTFRLHCRPVRSTCKFNVVKNSSTNFCISPRKLYVHVWHDIQSFRQLYPDAQIMDGRFIKFGWVFHGSNCKCSIYNKAAFLLFLKDLLSLLPII